MWKFIAAELIFFYSRPSNSFLVVLLMVIAIKISQGVIFDCDFNFYGEFPVLGYVYTCRPNVIASESGLFLEDVRGNHLEGMSNRDVECLWIYQQNLTFIPKDIEKFFPN